MGASESHEHIDLPSSRLDLTSNNRTLCAAHETIIMNEVARLYPLHLHAEDPDVAYLQIAYDAAVTIVEELNRAEPEPE